MIWVSKELREVKSSCLMQIYKDIKTYEGFSTTLRIFNNIYYNRYGV
jgi:hypothetical protein